jgi:secreted PhoX family phosphatase
MNRRNFLKGSTVLGGALALGPLQALTARAATGAPGTSPGYGPLVDKGDLWLPAEFNYQIISKQGTPMSNGQPTPGIFDGMAAFRGRRDTTILIRNHENRERAGEQKVLVPSMLEYDALAAGGNTKLEVRSSRSGRDPLTGQDLYTYEVLTAFAILGGTSTNCAGGIRHGDTWITCEEVVKRSSNGVKHGYVFEIDAYAGGPVAALPVPRAGRRAHEAAFELGNIVYLTEDRSITDDARTRNGKLGACFYRCIPENPARPLAGQSSGTLQALKVRDEFHANMDTERVVGTPYPVEWVTVDEPDHDDDTDDRRDRVSGFTPNRVQAQDKGAAFFDRLEGMWVSRGELGNGGKVYFDATAGGAQNLGQVWEYDPRRETVTLIYEGTDEAKLQAPDNVVIVPHTGDIFLQEDGDAEQYVRGVTVDGLIYDFARTGANETEFCGGCFDPDGHTFYLNQQGERGNLPAGPPDNQAVTYAIYGPFASRVGPR